MGVAPRKWHNCMQQPVGHMRVCVTVLLATHMCAGLALTCMCATRVLDVQAVHAIHCTRIPLYITRVSSVQLL